MAEHDQEDGGAANDEYDFVRPKNSAEPIDLVELQVWPPRQGCRRNNIPVWADLRFAEHVISTDAWRLEVRLAQAELSAEFRGCFIEQGSRLGDTAKKIFEVSTEHEKEELNLSRSGQANVKVALNLPEAFSTNAGIQAEGKAEKHSTKATERTTEIQRDRIRSLPNDRWRVSEPDNNKHLDGTYLKAPNKDDVGIAPLCELRVPEANNKFSITLSVAVRPHDLKLTFHSTKLKSWLTSEKPRPNQEAVAKLQVQAAATQRFGRPNDDRITIARSSMEGRRKKLAGDRQ